MSLSTLIGSLASDESGSYSIDVPADWTQGRTLYGGLNAALTGQVARLATPELGPLRALQLAFLAPASNRLRYVPNILRRGRSVTFVGVDCFSTDSLCARAILTYGEGRASDLHQARLNPPGVAEPDSCPVLPTNFDGAPAFFSQMDVRFASGSLPMSGGEPSFAMWVRHRDAGSVSPETGLLAIADVLPPAELASRTEFRPASSITWTVDLAEPIPSATSWYLLTSTSDHVADGYSLQGMYCFGADGRLAAVSRQTVALF